MTNRAAIDPTRALLFAALRPQPDDFADLLSRHREAVDWDWLLERAAAHKVDALLASRVATTGTAAYVPAEARERLGAAAASARERHDQGVRDLERVDRCLGRAGISYILVKGPLLTQQVYDNPAQRRFFDLDVVIRTAEIDAAQAALEGLGYRLWGGYRYLGFTPPGAGDLARATRLMRRSLRRFAHELALVTDDRSLLPIDLHWHLMPRRRIRADAAGPLWESVTRASVGGIDVCVLEPEATLLHLAMHAWSNRPWSFALLHLCDVAWALQRLPVDGRRLLDLADRWGGRGDLGRTLYAVEHVLGVMPAPALHLDEVALPPSNRFRRIATRENLLEHSTRPAPNRWARLRQEIDWGLAMESSSSTALLLLGKYSALLRYHAGRLGFDPCISNRKYGQDR